MLFRLLAAPLAIRMEMADHPDSPQGFLGAYSRILFASSHFGECFSQSQRGMPRGNWILRAFSGEREQNSQMSLRIVLSQGRVSRERGQRIDRSGPRIGLEAGRKHQESLREAHPRIQESFLIAFVKPSVCRSLIDIDTVEAKRLHLRRMSCRPVLRGPIWNT